MQDVSWYLAARVGGFRIEYLDSHLTFPCRYTPSICLRSVFDSAIFPSITVLMPATMRMSGRQDGVRKKLMDLADARPPKEGLRVSYDDYLPLDRDTEFLKKSSGFFRYIFNEDFVAVSFARIPKVILDMGARLQTTPQSHGILAAADVPGCASGVCSWNASKVATARP